MYAFISCSVNIRQKKIQGKMCVNAVSLLEILKKLLDLFCVSLLAYAFFEIIRDADN